MQNLLYSPTERILFWIAGYTASNNTSSVIEMTNDLQAKADEIAGKAGRSLAHVCTRTVTQSRRYKYMQVFWLPDADPVDDAYLLSGDWTMDKWIDN